LVNKVDNRKDISKTPNCETYHIDNRFGYHKVFCSENKLIQVPLVFDLGSYFIIIDPHIAKGSKCDEQKGREDDESKQHNKSLCDSEITFIAL
jgi:hypothetical protein